MSTPVLRMWSLSRFFCQDFGEVICAGPEGQHWTDLLQDLGAVSMERIQADAGYRAAPCIQMRVTCLSRARCVWRRAALRTLAGVAEPQEILANAWSCHPLYQPRTSVRHDARSACSILHSVTVGRRPNSGQE